MPSGVPSPPPGPKASLRGHEPLAAECVFNIGTASVHHRGIQGGMVEAP